MTHPNWLHPLNLPMPATLGSVNVYLIRGPQGVALIDTGMNDVSSLKALRSALQSLNLRIKDIETVLCTHHHADHAGLGKTFGEAGAQIMMSKSDATSLREFFQHPEFDAQRATFFNLHDVPEEFVTRVAPMFPFFRGLGQAFEPDIQVADGEVISLGGIPFTVHLTPGHTLGHICILFENELLFSGDCITSGNATHISMRREVMGKNPLRKFLDSLVHLSQMDITTTLPGHGRPITDLHARTASIISYHHNCLDEVAKTLLGSPQTAYEITTNSLGPRRNPFAKWLAMSQTLAYLEHLEFLGRATKIETPTGLCYKK